MAHGPGIALHCLHHEHGQSLSPHADFIIDRTPRRQWSKVKILHGEPLNSTHEADVFFFLVLTSPRLRALAEQ